MLIDFSRTRMLSFLSSFLELCSLCCRWQCFFLNADNPSIIEDKVGGLLSLGSGGEDGLAVALEDLQPVVDILRMAHVLKGDAGMGTEEGGADLGHQFLKGIAEITEAGAEHPVQPVGMPGPMTDFMVASGIVEIIMLEAGPMGQEHPIRTRQIAGLVAAML